MRWAAVLLGLALFLSAGSCGGEEGCEGVCECTGAACVCPSSGDCAINCVDMCDLQCAGSGNCDFECGPMCLAACTGSGVCFVSVGDDSTVDCPGASGCDVVCDGDCTVQCPGSGECAVQCLPGFVCNITQCSGSLQSCPDGLSICNGECPP